MNDQRFDNLTRNLASSGYTRVTRRAVLRALGLGGAATASGLVTVATRGAGAGSRATAQALPRGREPGGPAPDQVAFDLDYDVERIFHFVAAEVRYDPYRGALRGPKGTLWSLAGNSVDQALLLAALLEQALVKTRLMIGTLDDETAVRLLGAARLDADAARTDAARILTSSAAVAETLPSPSPEQRRFAETLPAVRDQFLAQARTQAAANAGLISRALAAAGVTLPPLVSALPDQERTHHVWLQYASGPTWVDLDPSIPGAVPGTAYARPTDTVDQLPEEFFHRVSFRVTGEFVSGGQPVTQELLRAELMVSDLVGKPVTLIHVKPGWLGGEIAGAIEGTERYEPHLLVDDQVFKGSPLTFTTGEGALVALGGEVSAEGQPTAEWLEIDVISPDAPLQTASRNVFDRLTQDQRYGGQQDLANLPPLPLIQDDELGSVYVPMLGTWSIAVHGGRPNVAYFAQDYTVEDQVADRAMVAHGYGFARERVQYEMMAELGYRFFHDGPNLTAFVLTPESLASDGATVALGIDLLHQQLGALPIAGASAAPFHPLVVAGALSHATERALMERAATFWEHEIPSGFRSVARVFEEAERAGIPIATILPGDDAAKLAISARARAGIVAALTSGFAVVVPEQSVLVDGAALSGWWQIDPATGRTFDRMEDGTGSTLPEWAYVVFKMTEVLECALALGNTIASVINALDLNPGGAGGYKYPAHLGLHEALGGIACAAAIAH